MNFTIWVCSVLLETLIMPAMFDNFRKVATLFFTARGATCRQASEHRTVHGLSHATVQVQTWMNCNISHNNYFVDFIFIFFVFNKTIFHTTVFLYPVPYNAFLLSNYKVLKQKTPLIHLDFLLTQTLRNFRIFHSTEIHHATCGPLASV